MYSEGLAIHRRWGLDGIRGLLIGASEYGVKGKDPWVANGDRKEDGEKQWSSMGPHSNFDPFMKCYKI